VFIFSHFYLDFFKNIVQKSYCFSYCTQGPLWKHIRGTGLVYGFSLNLKPNESMIYLTIEETLSPAKAYKEITKTVVSTLKYFELLTKNKIANAKW